MGKSTTDFVFVFGKHQNLINDACQTLALDRIDFDQSSLPRGMSFCQSIRTKAWGHHMETEHPNIQLVKRLDITDLASTQDLFAKDFVWHYFNPNLPEIAGDYVGLDGLRSFFQIIGGKTGGTFRVEPVSITAVGDELVVVHVRDWLTFQGQSIALDVVVVWRINGGRFVEAWDIVPVQSREVTDAGH